MIACLLPARNCERDLPGWLECVDRFADTVIALDDGSTDSTAQLLEASPLVETVLRNPRRETYAGWDDAANRRRLLDAAREAGADWVLFLDADERIDADDADALRRFVETDALPGCAYSLQVFRAWEDQVVASPTHAYRLFALAPGYTLPGDRLHFNPVPMQIPRAAWVRTTIRVRHLDSASRLEERRRKYEQADPGRRFERESTRALTHRPGGLVEWRPRPAALPVIAPPEELAMARPGTGAALLACLLPARNCERDLPGWLECVDRFADTVIALDDGSTDSTAQLLEASPLVETVLRNPRRETYAGWDDAANRRRLLDAAREAGADWVLFLDADERIDADDADALRRFVDSGADPGCAYGFRVFRMVGDDAHYDRAELWVYRLFATAAGSELPRERLHLVPVPGSIPRQDWLKTTIRIKHLGGADEDRRRARLRKYEQADPERRWQRDYAHLVADPGQPRPWRERPAGFPVLASGDATGSVELDLEALDPGAPLLSAIVISRDDEATIERSVRAVVEQDCPQPFEVIVAVSGHDRTEEIVRARFPGVIVTRVPEPGLPGAARNAGLALARGEYVSFPGSHVELSQGSLAARLRAHEQGWSMVTASVRNGTPTPAGWAAYFLDHSTSLPGRPPGELPGAPAHCSYVREFLLEVGGFPEDMRAGEDTVVNNELWRRGHKAFRSTEAELVHRNPCTTPARLVRHHFIRGRALARILREGGRRFGRRQLARYFAGYARRRLSDTDVRVLTWGDGLEERYSSVRRWVKTGIAAAWAGAWFELIVGRR